MHRETVCCENANPNKLPYNHTDLDKVFYIYDWDTYFNKRLSQMEQNHPSTPSVFTEGIKAKEASLKAHGSKFCKKRRPSTYYYHKKSKYLESEISNLESYFPQHWRWDRSVPIQYVPDVIYYISHDKKADISFMVDQNLATIDLPAFLAVNFSQKQTSMRIRREFWNSVSSSLKIRSNNLYILTSLRQMNKPFNFRDIGDDQRNTYHLTI